MSAPFGLLFDMDGVIVNSNPVHSEAIDRFCRKYGYDPSINFLKQHVYGRTNREWIPEVFKDIGPEECDRLAMEKEQLFRELFSPEEAVIPGLHHFLNEMQQHQIPMVLATSAPAENAHFILNRLDISGHFDVLLTSADVTTGKPDPEIYLKASRSISRPPNECIVIEDSLAGVTSAYRAGTRLVGITSTHTADELELCDLVVPDFQGLSYLRLLEVISSGMPETIRKPFK